MYKAWGGLCKAFSPRDFSNQINKMLYTANGAGILNILPKSMLGQNPFKRPILKAHKKIG